MTTNELVILIRHCISINDMSAFYTSPEWRNLRNKIILDTRKEGCYYCKRKGLYSRATILHHDRHVRKHPELALSFEYQGNDKEIKRNLFQCCDGCHKEQHSKINHQFNTERWD